MKQQNDTTAIFVKMIQCFYWQTESLTEENPLQQMVGWIFLSLSSSSAVLSMNTPAERSLCVVLVVVESPVEVGLHFTVVPPLQYCDCVISPHIFSVRLFVEMKAKFSQSSRKNLSALVAVSTLCYSKSVTPVQHYIQQSTDGYEKKSLSAAGNDENHFSSRLSAQLRIKPRHQKTEKDKCLLQWTYHHSSDSIHNVLSWNWSFYCRQVHIFLDPGFLWRISQGMDSYSIHFRFRHVRHFIPKFIPKSW